MLTYEKDIKPIKITAREAYNHAVDTGIRSITLSDDWDRVIIEPVKAEL